MNYLIFICHVHRIVIFMTSSELQTRCDHTQNRTEGIWITLFCLLSWGSDPHRTTFWTLDIYTNHESLYLYVMCIELSYLWRVQNFRFNYRCDNIWNCWITTYIISSNSITYWCDCVFELEMWQIVTFFVWVSLGPKPTLYYKQWELSNQSSKD